MSVDPTVWAPPQVVLAGTGMGRKDICEGVLQWIHRAEVLAGGSRHLEWFPEHPGLKIPLQGPLKEWLDRVDQVSRERRTAVLASGDPFFFGIGRRLVERLGAERVVTFPNITSVQVFFARLNEPWGDVKVMSLHGRPEWPHGSQWLRQVRGQSRVVLFTDPQHSPDWVARQLLLAGITDRLLVVAENLGQPSERIQRLSLEDASQREFSPLNLVGVFSQDSHAIACDVQQPWPVMGLPETAFQHQAGLITKMEIRMVVLAHLQLEPDLVLWDLGAGSGSVSIEASRVAPLRLVAAVEKDETRYRDLLENVRRFQCVEVRAIHGRALEVVGDLPDPDRVFIGGSGGDLMETLSHVMRRLRPGGRVVVTAVTLETLDAVRSFWQDKPFQMSITQLQVNRTVPVGKALRLEALNPVFVITAWPESR